MTASSLFSVEPWPIVPSTVSLGFLCWNWRWGRCRLWYFAGGRHFCFDPAGWISQLAEDLQKDQTHRGGASARSDFSQVFSMKWYGMTLLGWCTRGRRRWRWSGEPAVLSRRACCDLVGGLACRRAAKITRRSVLTPLVAAHAEHRAPNADCLLDERGWRVWFAPVELNLYCAAIACRVLRMDSNSLSTPNTQQPSWQQRTGWTGQVVILLTTRTRGKTYDVRIVTILFYSASLTMQKDNS